VHQPVVHVTQLAAKASQEVHAAIAPPWWRLLSQLTLNAPAVLC
jgi:hypothetical protein